MLFVFCVLLVFQTPSSNCNGHHQYTALMILVIPEQVKITLFRKLISSPCSTAQTSGPNSACKRKPRVITLPPHPGKSIARGDQTVHWFPWRNRANSNTPRPFLQRSFSIDESVNKNHYLTSGVYNSALTTLLPCWLSSLHHSLHDQYCLDFWIGPKGEHSATIIQQEQTGRTQIFGFFLSSYI